MFLIRAAFWIGLAVLLLPSDSRRQADLRDKAAAAVQWTVTFCDRNGETCVKAADLWQTFKYKAEFGARLAGDLIQNGTSNGIEPVAAPPADTAPAAKAMPAVGHGSLAPGDVQPKWRAQPSRPRA